MNKNIEQKIKAFLEEKLLVNFDAKVTPTSNLFELGFIDSYGFMELVKFMEGEFNIQFSSDELVSSSLVSLVSMTHAIENKLNAAA